MDEWPPSGLRVGCARVHDNESCTRLENYIHDSVYEYGGNGEIGCSEIKNLLQLITQREIFAT